MIRKVVHLENVFDNVFGEEISLFTWVEGGRIPRNLLAWICFTWVNLSWFFFSWCISFCIGSSGSSGGLSHTSLTPTSSQPYVSVPKPQTQYVHHREGCCLSQGWLPAQERIFKCCHCPIEPPGSCLKSYTRHSFLWIWKSFQFMKMQLFLCWGHLQWQFPTLKPLQIPAASTYIITYRQARQYVCHAQIPAASIYIITYRQARPFIWVLFRGAKCHTVQKLWLTAVCAFDE